MKQTDFDFLLSELYNLRGKTQAKLNKTAQAASVAYISGMISAGTNISITGAGSAASPYVINSTGGSSGSGSFVIDDGVVGVSSGSFTLDDGVI